MSEAELAGPADSGDAPIIETREVTRHFLAWGTARPGRAREGGDGVSLSISRGETLALVSGFRSGKTTFSRSA
jgi:ABC-type glutathione transport system ATPase component